MSDKGLHLTVLCVTVSFIIIGFLYLAHEAMNNVSYEHAGRDVAPRANRETIRLEATSCAKCHVKNSYGR